MSPGGGGACATTVWTSGLSSVVGGGEPTGSGSCTGVSLAGSSGREPGVAGWSGPIAGSRPLGAGNEGEGRPDCGSTGCIGGAPRTITSPGTTDGPTCFTRPTVDS